MSDSNRIDKKFKRMATEFNGINELFTRMNATITSTNINTIRNNIKKIRDINSRLDNINKDIATTRTDFSRTAAKLAIKIRSSPNRSVNTSVSAIIEKIVNQRGLFRGNISTLNNKYVNEIPIKEMPGIIEKLEGIVKNINNSAKAIATAKAQAEATAKAQAEANAKTQAEAKNRENISRLQNKIRKAIKNTGKALYGNNGNANKPSVVGRASRELNNRLNEALVQ